MTFAVFTTPPPGSAGFDVLAGRPQGLRRVMWVARRLPAGDLGPVHVHDGDEILWVVSGVIVVRCGDEQRQCTAGQLMVVPPRVLHGFRVVEETVLEVVAEYDIGTLYPVRADTGSVELVEGTGETCPGDAHHPPARTGPPTTICNRSSTDSTIVPSDASSSRKRIVHWHLAGGLSGPRQHDGRLA